MCVSVWFECVIYSTYKCCIFSLDAKVFLFLKDQKIFERMDKQSCIEEKLITKSVQFMKRVNSIEPTILNANEIHIKVSLNEFRANQFIKRTLYIQILLRKYYASERK